MFESYNEKLKLLIQVLPFVTGEKCFALHGGTAINLFVRDMPRLSVDIDLTYLPIEDRPTTLKNINAALDRTKLQIEKKLSGTRVVHKDNIGKLIINRQRAEIKLEVNLVGRGALSDACKACSNNQEKPAATGENFSFEREKLRPRLEHIQL